MKIVNIVFEHEWSDNDESQQEKPETDSDIKSDDYENNDVQDKMKIK